MWPLLWIKTCAHGISRTGFEHCPSICIRGNPHNRIVAYYLSVSIFINYLCQNRVPTYSSLQKVVFSQHITDLLPSRNVWLHLAFMIRSKNTSTPYSPRYYHRLLNGLMCARQASKHKYLHQDSLGYYTHIY